MTDTQEQQLKEELTEAQEQLNKEVDAAGREAEQQAVSEGLSEREVAERIQKARKEEKDKLYPQLEEMKSALKEVQETLRAEREEKEQMRREAEEKAEAQRVAKLSDSQKTLEAIKRMEEQLKQEKSERLRIENEISEHRRKEMLRLYRERAIARVGKDNLIEELVRGDSEEEIDKSVAIAKARYEQLVERAKTTAGEQVRRAMRSANPDTEALEEDELERSLDSVDFDKYNSDPNYKARVRAQMEQLYKRRTGLI